jgi:hypothetical protein
MSSPLADDDSPYKYSTGEDTDGTEYRDDGLYMKEGTTVDEVIAFLRSSIEDPEVVEDTVVWNFSTHEVDEEALAEVPEKEQDRFLIPYQVTGAWGFMFSLLPEEIRRAEVLVYDQESEQYKAYRSLYRTTTSERCKQIQSDLSRRMVKESGDELGLTE